MYSAGQRVGGCGGGSRFLPGPPVTPQEGIVLCMCASGCTCRCAAECLKELAVTPDPTCATLAVCNGRAIGMS